MMSRAFPKRKTGFPQRERGVCKYAAGRIAISSWEMGEERKLEMWNGALTMFSVVRCLYNQKRLSGNLAVPQVCQQFGRYFFSRGVSGVPRYTVFARTGASTQAIPKWLRQVRNIIIGSGAAATDGGP